MKRYWTEVALRLSWFIAVIAFLAVLTSCVTRPVNSGSVDDICQIFKDRPKWYQAAKKSTSKWGGNIQLPMAIIYQESTFSRKARPKRKKILGIFPGSRPSDAYGYAQALKSTWGDYEKDISRKGKRRDSFADAFDFVQWYINKTHTRNGVSKWDYGAQYLNYHEGHGGYSRRTHLSKKWLLNTSERVRARAKSYGTQLTACSKELDARKTSWF